MSDESSTPDQTVPSLADLMAEAFLLSLKLVYETMLEDGTYFDPREKLDERRCPRLSAWADGLMHKHYQNMAEGTGSLSARIDFDVAAFEEKVVADIAAMKKMLEEHTPIRVIPKQELAARGYRGPNAGYTKLEDAQHYYDWALSIADGTAASDMRIKEYADKLEQAKKEVV